MATWTNDNKLSGQPSITYNESGKTYNEANVQYNGKVQTTWTNDTKN